MILFERKASSPRLAKLDATKQREFIEGLAKKLNIQHPSDWYKADLEKKKEVPPIDEVTLLRHI